MIRNGPLLTPFRFYDPKYLVKYLPQSQAKPFIMFAVLRQGV